MLPCFTFCSKVFIIFSFFCSQQWGTGWGENGYVRIRREKGSKGEPGQCGIACSPSVALGGKLLEQVNGMISRSNDDMNENQLRSTGGINDPVEANDSSHPLDIVLPYTILEKICLRLGHSLENHSQCGMVADYVSVHRAMVLGTIGLLATLFLVVWPLTSDCRRRAHRRRMRKLQQQLVVREHDLLMGIHDDETSTLIIQNGVASSSYGSTINAAH